MLWYQAKTIWHVEYPRFLICMFPTFFQADQSTLKTPYKARIIVRIFWRAIPIIGACQKGRIGANITLEIMPCEPGLSEQTPTSWATIAYELLWYAFVIILFLYAFYFCYVYPSFKALCDHCVNFYLLTSPEYSQKIPAWIQSISVNSSSPEIMLASLRVLVPFLSGPFAAAVLLYLLSNQLTGAHLHHGQLDLNEHQRRLPACSNHQGDTRCLVNEPLSTTVVFPPLPTPSGHHPVADTTRALRTPRCSVH